MLKRPVKEKFNATIKTTLKPGKGAFFMRTALRYHISKQLFAQIGLKTLDDGSADYVEYVIGFQPFSW